RFTAIDWILLAAVGAVIVADIHDIAVVMRSASHPTPWTVLGWPTDALLGLLMVEALILYRSVQQTGAGWVGRCWKSFSVGILLVALGNAAVWATNWGYLPWPWSALGWYVWLP